MNINIRCFDLLPPNTMLVSPDLYKLLKEQYTVEAIDRQFLKVLGIKEEEKKDDSVG